MGAVRRTLFVLVSLAALLAPVNAVAWAQADPCSGSSTGPCAFPRASLSVSALGYVYYNWPDGAGNDISYGASALGVSEDGSTLYIACNVTNAVRGIAKIAVPSIGGTGTVVDSCKGPNYTAITAIMPGPWDAGQALLGGVVEVGGRVVVSAYGSYDANAAAIASHWSGTSLSSLSGPFIGTVSPGMVKGQMGVIPAEWRSLLGGSAYSVSGYTSIISRQSYGPSFTVFDPTTVTANNFPMTQLLGCPHSQTSCSSKWTAWGPSSTDFQGAELAAGTFIVPGTRTLVVVEREGRGTIPPSGGTTRYEGYGYTTTNIALHGEPYDVNPAEGVRWLYSLSDPLASKGNKAWPYYLAAKLYDLKDLYDVKQGTKNMWDVQPYNVVELPGTTDNQFAVNGTYDINTDRLYLAESAGGGLNALRVYTGFGALSSGGGGGTSAEQILGPFTNGATCAVSTGYNSSATTVVLSTGCGARLPTPGSDGIRAVWYNATDYPNGYDDPNYEVITITARSGDTLTLATRGGIEGTSATAKNTAGKTYVINVGVTADAFNKLDTANDASYVTLATNTGLPNERVLTAGTAIGLTDGGAGSTVTVAVNDAELTSIAGVTSAANALPYYTGSGTATTTTLSSFGRTLIDDADATTARSTLGVVIGTNVQAQDGELAALAGLTSAANALPYFTGAGTAATTTLTSAARSVLDDTTTGAMLTTLGAQPADADLTALAGLTSAADKGIQFTGSGTAATFDLTTAGKALLDDANAAAQRTTLGLVIGTNVQAQDAELAALAGTTSAANALPYFSGSGTATTTTLSSFGRTLIDDADAATARATLGVTFSKSIIVESPTASENLSFFFTDAAITVVKMSAVLVGSSTPSVTWSVRHGTDRSAAGSDVVTGGTTTTSTTTGSVVTSFNNAAIAANSYVWVATTAQSGTVGQIVITVYYTLN